MEMARDRTSAVEMIHLVLASWVAGAVGLLLTLLWTASFVPEFLQPTSATVMLAKPLPQPRVDAVETLVRERGFDTVLFAASVLSADLLSMLTKG